MKIANNALKTMFNRLAVKIHTRASPNPAIDVRDPVSHKIPVNIITVRILCQRLDKTANSKSPNVA